MREDFSLFRLPEAVSALFPPDRDGLFDLIRGQIPESSLRVISRCDYDTESEAHFAALCRLRDRIDLDKPIGWMPGEVLSLYRWTRPTDQRDFHDLKEFHLARAFACTALMVTRDEFENQAPFSADVVGPLLEATLALGDPYLTEFSELMTYAITTLGPWDVEFLFAAFALYASYVLSNKADDSVAKELGEWLAVVHAEALAWYSSVIPLDSRTFLDIEFSTIQPGIWRETAIAIVDMVPEYPGFIRLVMRPEPFSHRVARTKRNVTLGWYGLRIAPSILGQVVQMVRRPKRS